MNVRILAAVLLFLAIGLRGAVLAQSFVISTTDPIRQRPVTAKVFNETIVTVTVNKRPNETCSIETQREEKTEQEPISNFIATLVKAVAPASAAPACPSGVTPPSNFPPAQQIENRLVALQDSITPIHRAAESLRKSISDAAALGNELVTCRATNGSTSSLCDSVATYQGQVGVLQQRLGAAINTNLPSTDGLDIQLAHIQDLLKETEKNTPADASDPFYAWLRNVYARVDCLAVQMRIIKQNNEFVAGRRDAASKLLEAFDRLEVSTQKDFVLPPDENSKIAGKISCKNFFSNTPTINPVPISITYQGPPRLSLTAGLLYSTLDKRKVGTEAVRVEDSFKTVVSESASSSQLIPFSFLDLRLAGFSINSTPIFVNFGVGAGVNSNNGGKEVEYFVGPSLSVRNIHLHLGVHRGRFAEPRGGYKIGDIVPNSGFPGVPVGRDYKNKAAIAISYRLPLN